MANTTAMYFKLHLRKRLKKTLLLKPHDNIFQLLTMRTTVLFVALLVAAFARSKGPNIMCGLCEVFAAVLEGKFERSDKDIGKVCVIDLSYLTCKEMNSHESATCIAKERRLYRSFLFIISVLRRLLEFSFVVSIPAKFWSFHMEPTQLRFSFQPLFRCNPNAFPQNFKQLLGQDLFEPKH